MLLCVAAGDGRVVHQPSVRLRRVHSRLPKGLGGPEGAPAARSLTISPSLFLRHSRKPTSCVSRTQNMLFGANVWSVKGESTFA